jgi:photosystem II stability/assembly factor-like uncharacterized protein
VTDSSLVNSVPVRSIGPAVMSGRVVDIGVAESPGVRGGALGTVIYIAAATGGVWKSTNGGVSWEPVFDDAGVGSVGAVAVARSNSNVVWVGTGESNNMRSSSYGDGVYKSIDGGATFTHMGLRTSQHVARIVIHPTNPNIVYVAAVGPLWGPGGERGLYKTTDGGRTWNAALEIDEHTGVTDVAMDPTDPNVLYAATLQRERRAYSYVGGGPGSGIHKTTDGGETWEEVTAGLPKGDMGRIGLAVSHSQPRTLYAVVEGSDDEEGVYRSDDHGAVWRKTSDISSIPWFFGQIRVDPWNPEIVYHLGVPLMRSTDGGRTFEERLDQGTHVDHHSMWINPENPHHIILGNDGGLYISHDFGETWDYAVDLPISQFYAVGYDMQEPFFGVYGGLQDNQTWGGPSRTRNAMGITNAEWYLMAGGDGFYAAVDPTDHNIAYVESQNGNIQRFDGRTGERKGIRPQPAPDEDDYRFNWSAPIKISPFDPSTVYFAANHVFKSTDRGDSWSRLGEDLTREIDRDSLPMMGAIPDEDAVSRHQGTAVFSNISTLDLSALRQGLLVTGSDDGVVAVSRDDGLSWRKMTRFPGVPDTTYVSRVVASRHAEAVMYATMDGHRSNDFRPYVVKSTDYGETWRSISSNLPEFGSVRAFAEHHTNPDLLFVGTEVAPFVSIDGGASWMRIRGVPPAPVHDLAIHPRDNSLIVGTHGRGIYLIDDLAAFEHLAAAKTGGDPYMFPISPPIVFRENGAPQSGTRADRDYAGQNPDIGATITYLVRERPSGDFKLEILNSTGRAVRTLEASNGTGMHHVLWDLRAQAPYAGPPEEGRRQGGFGGFGAAIPPTQGPLVVPGNYTARITITPDDGAARVLEEAFRVRPDDQVMLAEADLQRLYDLRDEWGRLSAAYSTALRAAEQLRREVTGAQNAMEQVDVSDEITEQADTLLADIDAILTALRGRQGPPTDEDEEEDDTPNVQQRLRTAAGINQATALPTQQESDALGAVPAELETQVNRINEILNTRMPAFRSALDSAGVPWSPGRVVRMR